MKPITVALIAIAIAALTASSAVAQNTVARKSDASVREHRVDDAHSRLVTTLPSPVSFQVLFDLGFGFPFGYGFPYGYSYYPRPRVVIYETAAADGSIVVEVQRRLARAGYYRGAIDGVIGNETRRAIRAYERGHGLPVDGRLDQQLLATMGLA